MNRSALATLAAAAFALTGCGSSDSANEAASPDNVEMPAEEAVGGVDATATPATDAEANATTAASDAATPGAEVAASDGADTAKAPAGPSAAEAAAEKQ